MIKVNGYIVKHKNVLHGEIAIDNFDEFFDINKESDISIEWFWDGDNAEMMKLFFIVKHLKEIKRSSTMYTLYMPYAPYGKVSEVEDERKEIFTLKHFADFINELGFDRVEIIDPQSMVAPALIRNCSIDKELTNQNISDLMKMNKYDAILTTTYYRLNHRECFAQYPFFNVIQVIDKDGYVVDHKIVDYKKEYKNILIVNEFCSDSDTILDIAKKLVAKKVDHIDLYVTHCSPSVYKGDMIYSGLIDTIYTTNSIMPMEPIVCRDGAERVTPVKITQLSYYKPN